MRLTQEIDYGFRIVGYLAQHDGEIIGAPIISSKLAIPERFTLRILRKLNLAGITKAKRGAHGGYMLLADKNEITLYDVILALDGPIIINRCLLEDDPYCSRMHKDQFDSCNFHLRLAEIQAEIVKMFKESKIIDIINKENNPTLDGNSESGLAENEG